MKQPDDSGHGSVSRRPLGAAAEGGERLRVGIVGLGRSGWNIHALTFQQMPALFRVVAVSDPVAERQAEAEQAFGCRSFTDFDALLRGVELDLLVVASPNHLHTDHAIAGMAAGFDVVCEKPFALSVEDAGRAIAASRRYGRVLAPFQHRRYEPHFQEVARLLRSGTLGRVVQVRMTWHQFTRRWDWQTLRRFGGGLLHNNGSHLLDQALQLLPDDVEPSVHANLQRVLSLGDTEDHVKIILQAPGCPTLDVELSNASAFPQDRWHIMADAGGLRGTPERLEYQTLDWSTMPARQLETEAAPGRIYHKDRPAWRDHVWTHPTDAEPEYHRFYRDLHATLRQGAPLVITPESVRRLIHTLERCYEQCPQIDAVPLGLTP